VLSRKAEEMNQIGAAVHAKELIGKHRGMFVEFFAWSGDPDELSDHQREVLIDSFLRMVYDGDAEKMAAARSRVEAEERAKLRGANSFLPERGRRATRQGRRHERRWSFCGAQDFQGFSYGFRQGRSLHQSPLLDFARVFDSKRT